MDNNIILYVDYFRQLAVRHTSLQHNVASETSDAIPKAKHFVKWNLNELISGLRTKIGDPCMMLELYETQTKAEMVYDIKQRPRGAFSVITTVKEGDHAGEETALALTEKIVYDILKRIWQDHYGTGTDRCTTPFYQFDFNKLDITTTGKILDNKMGWRVEFNFEFNHEIKFNDPPDPAAFIPDYVLGYGNYYLAFDNVSTDAIAYK